MDVARAQVQQLIEDQVKVVSNALLKAPNLLTRSNDTDVQQHDLNSDAIAKWNEILKSELHKVERLEASFVVVGTMKAGKSTMINTITGMELLPNRNQPMTSLPTVVRHCPGKNDPELFFSDPQPMNELVIQLRDILLDMQRGGSVSHLSFCVTKDGKELVQKIMDGSLSSFKENYKGRLEIFDFLKNINDIWRLCLANEIGLDIGACLRQYDDIQKFPTIEVEFAHMNSQEYGLRGGCFALIDMPGSNEAGQNFLKEIMREQLEKASAVIAVLDYTQLNAEADADIRRAINEVANVTDDRLFVFVNKFDQKDRHSMDAETLRSYVAKQLFEGRLEQSHIYPVSSRYGYLAARALRELQNFSQLPNYQLNPWVADFVALALGASWEDEEMNPAELENKALKLWRNSQFERPLAEVVQGGYDNAASTSLQSALSKMVTYNKRVIDSLQLRQNALSTDIGTIEDNIMAIKEKLTLIEDAQSEAQQLIEESNKILQERVLQVFDETDKIVSIEIEKVFLRENWIEQRLAPYFIMSPNKQSNITHHLCNDFSSKTDANNFIDKLVAVGAEKIEPRLQDMQTSVEAAIDEIVAGVWNGVNERLDAALQAAEKRLHETFSIEINFPKPSVDSINVDFSSLYDSSIRKDKVTRTNTKQKRKWYTLWCRKQTIIYRYEERVYRVYTKDVIEDIQIQMRKDMDVLGQNLDSYMHNEFKPSINDYFVETANCLKRVSNDLIDALTDKKLHNEKLEAKLQTINNILSLAHKQQENLLNVETNLYLDSESKISRPDYLGTFKNN